MAMSPLPSSTASSFALLSPGSQDCVNRLAAYSPPPDTFRTEQFPESKRAAVLILLFEMAGQLRVLLTTRAKSLRSHPGQTALPGGRIDLTDVDPVDAAFREASEEVSLPRNHPAIHTLCTLPPFLSQFKLHVTPIVAIFYDTSSPTTSPAHFLDTLEPSAAEVDRIFHFPLEAVLDPSLLLVEMEEGRLGLAEKGTEDWPYDEDLHATHDYARWLEHATYRMHRFRSCASCVKGLTADILLFAAELAYERPPAFERFAPTQPRTFMETARLLLERRGDESVKPET